MAKKLFVGNLPFSMTDDQFQQLFAAFGTVVSANIVIDKYSQRSKGFGFVEFETDEAAVAAMQALDGSEQQGRNIAVKEALPRPDRNAPASAPAPQAAPVAEPAEPVAEEIPVTEAPVAEETTESTEAPQA
ncbi:MAG: RNA-binding protein [Candidatus Shapirobacteria bacterium]|jgi:RNA recognition motif-containing protein